MLKSIQFIEIYPTQSLKKIIMIIKMPILLKKEIKKLKRAII
jgi:hypothetical protein